MLTQTKAMCNSQLANTYSRLPVEFVKGEGCYLFDENGNKYLDFLSGIAVTGFGHNNIEIKDAVQNQIDNLWHVSNLFESQPQNELARKLTESSGLESVFFSNSGSEANEAAIKFARFWGEGKSTIITTLGGFHGRTMGSLSATGQYKLWEGSFPLTPGFNYVPFNDIEAVENSIDKHTVAVMVEPIQGENGIIIPSENYLVNLRKLCNKFNLLLILDEVQTGMGRTGKLYAHQWENIIPDIITLAKGIANGFPLGATLCSEKVANSIKPGSHGSTFGGNPISIAAANKVFDKLSVDVLEHNVVLGKKIIDRILDQNHPSIKAVRGKGLMIGIEFQKSFDTSNFVNKMLEEKIVLYKAGNNTIRLLPPFVINETHIDLFIQKMNVVLLNN